MKVFNRMLRYKSLDLYYLEEKVLSLFKDEIWNDYVQNTRKVLSGFIRDQYLCAIDHFSGIGNRKVFQEALIYCSRENTYGMKALHDTYRFFIIKVEIKKMRS